MSKEITFRWYQLSPTRWRANLGLLSVSVKRRGRRGEYDYRVDEVFGKHWLNTEQFPELTPAMCAAEACARKAYRSLQQALKLSSRKRRQRRVLRKYADLLDQNP